MIHHFLNQIICISCHRKITVKKVSLKKKRIYKGILICKFCKIEYQIKKGVIIFSKDNRRNTNKIYDNYWNQLPVNFKRNKDKKEISIFGKFHKSFKNKIVFDAGCGDGRIISTICNHKPKLLIVADFTDIIFYTSKSFSNKFSNIPIIFIKIDLTDRFISKNFINSIISLGSINFKVNQKTIIKNLDSMAKNFLMIGLVSNTSFFGKFYQKLNPLRIFFKMKIMKLFVIFFKFLILNRFIRKIKIISILGDYFYSLLEFILSPLILRHNNIFYKNLINKKHTKTYTGKILDYMIFRSK